jgi:hypothetical protein
MGCRVGVGVRFYTWITEALGSSLCRDTSAPPDKRRNITYTVPRQLLSNPSQFICHPAIRRCSYWQRRKVPHEKHTCTTKELTSRNWCSFYSVNIMPRIIQYKNALFSDHNFVSNHTTMCLRALEWQPAPCSCCLHSAANASQNSYCQDLSLQAAHQRCRQRVRVEVLPNTELHKFVCTHIRTAGQTMDIRRAGNLQLSFWSPKFVWIIHKNLVRTSQETHCVSTINPNRLMLFRERVAVYCENHTEHASTLCGQNI